VTNVQCRKTSYSYCNFENSGVFKSGWHLFINPEDLEDSRLSGFILFIISLIYYFAYSIILLVLLFDTGLREND